MSGQVPLQIIVGARAGWTRRRERSVETNMTPYAAETLAPVDPRSDRVKERPQFTRIVTLRTDLEGESQSFCRPESLAKWTILVSGRELAVLLAGANRFRGDRDRQPRFTRRPVATA